MTSSGIALGQPSFSQGVRQWAGVVFGLFIVLDSAYVHAEPAMNGQTGLINMPDGRIEPDGTWRAGYSSMSPYSAMWTSFSFLPRLEVSARYTRMSGVQAFGGTTSFGDNKDKAFDAKFLLLNESTYLPSVAVGTQDFLGTRLFGAEYVAASKKVGDLDLTVGYGTKRIDGAFWGARYTPSFLPEWSLVVEKDANDYGSDRHARESGADKIQSGYAYGFEYRPNPLVGVQVAHRDKEWGAQAYITVPLNAPRFVPRLTEPAPYREYRPRPTEAEWKDDPAFRLRLFDALEKQDFRDVALRYDDGLLDASLNNIRISDMNRAVGRAARTMLLTAPLETTEIRISYTVEGMVVASYRFIDLDKLQRYFGGNGSHSEVAPYVLIAYGKQYANLPTPGRDVKETLASFAEEGPEVYLRPGEDGDAVALRARDRYGRGGFGAAPRFGMFFNDPSGAFRYEVFVEGSYRKYLRPDLVLKTTAVASLYENVSKVTQGSNSQLPHVRSDIADYKKDGKTRLESLTLSQYFQPAPRVYGRVSAGIYEQMFGGAGGQLLYMSAGAPWAFDVAVDALRQRDTKGGLGFRDYSTVTALASMHYRIPSVGVTTTARVGQFLAKDQGVRFEAKRRFRSGVEVGAWMSFTDGNDITTPGSPGNPYRDKGIFLSIPLETLLTRDTQAASNLSLAAWTRDVGQMVASPGDLYNIMEKPYTIDIHDGSRVRSLAE